MNTKYVFLDVDGTLVNFESKIPCSAIEALKKAQKNGHKMILATGRQKSQIYPELLGAVKFDGIMASAGAYVELDGKIVFISHPTPEKLSFVVDFFREHNIPYCLQSAKNLIAEDWCMERIRASMYIEGGDNRLFESVFGTTVITDDPKSLDCVEKMVYYQSPLGLDEVRAALGDFFNVVGYSLEDGRSDSKDSHGEITFDGINKAVGIQKFMDAVHAPISDSIAIGDSGNDLEMIKFAGTGVAMGNASESVKKAAELVTTDIDDDGIYNAFVKLGLI